MSALGDRLLFQRSQTLLYHYYRDKNEHKIRIMLDQTEFQDMKLTSSGTLPKQEFEEIGLKGQVIGLIDVETKKSISVIFDKKGLTQNIFIAGTLILVLTNREHLQT